MGAYGHFTEARLPEGSRCGRGRPPCNASLPRNAHGTCGRLGGPRKGIHNAPRPAVTNVPGLHHFRPLIRSSAVSTSASSITRSWRCISSAFRQAHKTLSRAQLSPSAPQQHGFPSLAVGAEFSPAGAVRPAGGLFGWFSFGMSTVSFFALALSFRTVPNPQLLFVKG